MVIYCHDDNGYQEQWELEALDVTLIEICILRIVCAEVT
jgi:hypothetical protein